MQEAFWNGLFDVRWESAPLGSEAIRLVLWLRERGFSERTRRDYGHATIHLGRVLHEKQADTNPRALNETIITDFIDHHFPVCCCYHQPAGKVATKAARQGLLSLLSMLREEGVIPKVVPEHPPYHELTEGYCRFLRDDRGLAESTVTNYHRYLRDFLISQRDAITPGDLTRLTAEDLLSFSRRRGARLSATAWNLMVLALSNFYRWLDLCGHGGRHLVGVVPLRKRYRLAEVPRALSWEQVQRLLAVVDRHEPNGHRNYAMLLMAATYGLRGGEILAFCLDNIDWSNDEITVFAPKTGRSRKLPLTQPVGEAILEYLRKERPASHHREVFLSSRPPHGPLRSKINRWLSDCLDKADVEMPRRGGHILRHSLAIHLLRSGETLKSIGDLLGHQSQDTTFIYTKLNVDDLRTVALEPEVVS